MTAHPPSPPSTQWGKVNANPGNKYHRIIQPHRGGRHVAACNLVVTWLPGHFPSDDQICSLCKHFDPTPIHTPEPNVSSNKIAQLTTQIAALQAEVARLSVLPKEPMPNVDDPMPTVRFQIQFELGGLTYHYAARRTSAKWYTTGPRGGSTPREWDDLVAWIDRSHVKGIQGAHLRLMIAGKHL